MLNALLFSLLALSIVFFSYSFYQVLTLILFRIPLLSSQSSFVCQPYEQSQVNNLVVATKFLILLQINCSFFFVVFFLPSCHFLYVRLILLAYLFLFTQIFFIFSLASFSRFVLSSISIWLEACFHI